MAYKDWFNDLCENTNKDLKQLAKKLGLHETVIGKLRRGERAIKADELTIICEFFWSCPTWPTSNVCSDK